MAGIRSWTGSALSLVGFWICRRFAFGVAAPACLTVIFALAYIWTFVLRVPDLRIKLRAEEDEALTPVAAAPTDLPASPPAPAAAQETPPRSSPEASPPAPSPPAPLSPSPSPPSPVFRPETTGLDAGGPPSPATPDAVRPPPPEASPPAAPPLDAAPDAEPRSGGVTPSEVPASGVAPAASEPAAASSSVPGPPSPSRGGDAGPELASAPEVGDRPAQGSASSSSAPAPPAGWRPARKRDADDDWGDDDEEAEAETARRRQAEEEALKDPVRAQELRLQGNELFKAGKLHVARESYSEALYLTPTSDKKDKAVLHCNRAACLQKLERWEEVVTDCRAAIELDPEYVKAYLRRSAAFESQNRWHDALEDLKKAIELQPELKSSEYRRQAMLEKRSQDQFEKDKEEMMSKLKDLGNTVLGKFGMSLDNFKLEQDPNSGGYSIKYQN